MAYGLMAEEKTEEQEGGTTPMGTITAEDADFYRDAAAIYRFMGEALLHEMTEAQIDIFAESDFDYPDDGSEVAEGYRWLRTYLKRRGMNARQDLAVDYARVFLAAGIYDGDTAAPYESVYLSDAKILMQESRDEVVELYRRYGFAVQPELQIPEDHAGFELEFAALLCDMIADAATSGTDCTDDLRCQLEFLECHLLKWLPALQKRVDSYAELRFYPALMRILIGALEDNRLMDKQLLAAAE